MENDPTHELITVKQTDKGVVVDETLLLKDIL